MKQLLFTLTLFCLATLLQAQQSGFRPCDTDVMWEQAVKNDPGAAERNRLLREMRKQFDQQKTRMQVQAHRAATGSLMFRIPVVFHVIHTYGSENISREQIEDAMRIMNLSFQKLNPDTGMVIPLFQPIFANPEVEFVLASIAPDGSCTDGITRTYSPLTAAASDNVKALVGWPSDKYFNIWVVQNIASGAAGYAYYPGVSGTIDGVVIRHDYVGGIGTSNGSNYTERSLTHEVGHWLDLPHTWGSTNTPGLASNCGTDDGIGDTPNTIGVNNFSCNTAQNTCGQIDNVQNYMDYASCHYMFTEGQKQAMQSALLSSIGNRFDLWQTSNLLATGTDASQTPGVCKPVADFDVRLLTLCQGSSVAFKDVSWGGAPTSRTWLFPGGTPATDTAASPVVTYNTPGIYDVQLIVANASGSDTLLRTAKVVVTASPGGTAVPYSEGFETIALNTAGWVVENPDNNNGWELFSGAAATGTKSVRLQNWIGNTNGVDALITPAFNASNISGAQMNFKYAFAAKNNNDASSLRVLVSGNCGTSWIPRLTKSGTTLRTTSNTSASYLPVTAHFVNQTVNLASAQFSGQSVALVKFEFSNDQGNNIYIDDINITGVVGTGEELASLYAFEAFPNPAADRMTVRIQSDFNADVRFELMDMAGRTMEVIQMQRTSGQISAELNGKGLSGVYLLRVYVNDYSFTRRVAFLNK